MTGPSTKHTDCRGYEINDEVILWFWKYIQSWPAEFKFRLLQFASGTSRIPVNGFKDLQGSDGPRRFTIEKAGDLRNYQRVILVSTALISRPLFLMDDDPTFIPFSE